MACPSSVARNRSAMRMMRLVVARSHGAAFCREDRCPRHLREVLSLQIRKPIYRYHGRHLAPAVEVLADRVGLWSTRLARQYRISGSGFGPIDCLPPRRWVSLHLCVSNLRAYKPRHTGRDTLWRCPRRSTLCRARHIDRPDVRGLDVVAQAVRRLAGLRLVSVVRSRSDDV